MSQIVYEPIAVIWRRPNSQDSLVEMPLVAFHNQLVSSTNHVNAISSVELCNNVTAKQIASTAWRHAPALSVFRIGPEKVTHGSVVRNLKLQCTRSHFPTHDKIRIREFGKPLVFCLWSGFGLGSVCLGIDLRERRKFCHRLSPRGTSNQRFPCSNATQCCYHIYGGTRRRIHKPA